MAAIPGIGPSQTNDSFFWRCVKIGVVVSALAAITALGLEKAQSLTDAKVVPFQGNLRANLAFGTFFASCVAGGTYLTRPAGEPQSVEDVKALLKRLEGIVYMTTDDTMIEQNAGYATKDAAIENLQTARYAHCLTIDGAPFETGAKLFETLTGTHGLSEERAIQVMNQVEVQIFGTPTVDLTNGFTYPALEVMVTAMEDPAESGLKIELTTTSAESFSITGAKKMRLSQKAETLAVFDLRVALVIPKDEAVAPTGSWSWSVASV